MLDLRDVLELINDGLDDSSLADHQTVKDGNNAALHVGYELGDHKFSSSGVPYSELTLV
jgi:hypothetical protein